MSYEATEQPRYLGGDLAISPRQESTRQRLERQKKSLETGLEEVNRAIKLLDENPKLEEFHEALRRV